MNLKLPLEILLQLASELLKYPWNSIEDGRTLAPSTCHSCRLRRASVLRRRRSSHGSRARARAPAAGGLTGRLGLRVGLGVGDRPPPPLRIATFRPRRLTGAPFPGTPPDLNGPFRALIEHLAKFASRSRVVVTQRL